MTDPAEVFAAARPLARGRDWAEIVPWGAYAPMAGLILRAMPVMNDGPGCWCPHPNPARAPRGAWRVIVAVRHHFDPLSDGMDADTTCINDATETLTVADGWNEWCKHRYRGAALHGGIIDCLACDAEIQKRPLSLTGFADCLGVVPQWGEPSYGPMPVHRTVHGWLESACDGIVLLGNDTAKHQELLLRCRDGIVGEDVAHARALKRLMERPVPDAPKVFVAAQPARAAA